MTSSHYIINAINLRVDNIFSFGTVASTDGITISSVSLEDGHILAKTRA